MGLGDNMAKTYPKSLIGVGLLLQKINLSTMKKIIVGTTLLLFAFSLFSQGVVVAGYIYDVEQENRLDEAQVNVYHNDFLLSNFIETDRNGTFKTELPSKGIYRLEIIRPAYQRQSIQIDTENKQLVRVAIPMTRLPGYEFLGTIKKLLANEEVLGEDIKDARIEIYNNTTGEEAFNQMMYPKATINFNFERGNRYTIMVRKKGFFAKRFDVMVNIDGCILCFEGLGSQYAPTIIDDLTQGHQKGVIEADIPIRPIQINETIRLDNIYYDYNKWNIRADARPPLDNLVQIMRATPIIIELGSHTDSRGKDEYNMELSQKRAQSAVDYIISRGIAPERITAQGYGESQLMNDCTNEARCNEREHQLNRRTEFKVTKIMTASSFDNKSLKEIIEIERAVRKRIIEILKVD